MSLLTLTFATPSLVGDSPHARAKVKRNLRKILREAERCLGPQELDQVTGDHGRARGGRTPNESLNELVLAEWDASPTKNKTKFSEDFFQEYFKECHNPAHHPRQLTVALYTWVRDNVAYWHKADIATVLNDVRYWG